MNNEVEVAEANGGPAPSITIEALADRGRFQFKRQELDVVDVTGVTLTLKTLSVAERDSMPDLTDKDGNWDPNVQKLAHLFAGIVEDVKVEGVSVGKPTKEQAEFFLGDWPSTALDQVIEKFGELTGGTKEERSAAAGTFPATD